MYVLVCTRFSTYDKPCTPGMYKNISIYTNSYEVNKLRRNKERIKKNNDLKYEVKRNL